MTFISNEEKNENIYNFDIGNIKARTLNFGRFLNHLIAGSADAAVALVTDDKLKGT